MELVGELFLTATLALFLSFLVAKLVAMAMAGDVAAARDSDSESCAIAAKSACEAEEVRYEECLRVQEGFVSETRVESVEEALEKKVDRLEEVGDEPQAQHRLGEEIGLVGERSETVGLPETIVSDGEEAAVEFDGRGVNGGCADDSVEKILENRGADGEIGVESSKNDVVSPSPPVPEEADVVVRESLKGKDEANEVELGNIGDEDEDSDDDWEGVEMNELENDFASAVKFVESEVAEDGGDRLASVGSDVQMELYGLRKVAMQGPCHEAQPLALDLSAQAKWNAWQRLGNLSPEMAMEQYITILSDKVPGWMEDHFAGEDKQESLKEEMPNTVAADFSTMLHHPQSSINQRESGLKAGAEPERVDFTGPSDLENRGIE